MNPIGYHLTVRGWEALTMYAALWYGRGVENPPGYDAPDYWHGVLVFALCNQEDVLLF